jgi:hypothetical protein
MSKAKKLAAASPPIAWEIHSGASKRFIPSFHATLKPVSPITEPKKPMGKYSRGRGVATESAMLVAILVVPEIEVVFVEF